MLDSHLNQLAFNPRRRKQYVDTELIGLGLVMGEGSFTVEAW